MVFVIHCKSMADSCLFLLNCSILWLIPVNSILLWFSFVCVSLRCQLLFLLYHFLSLFFFVSMVKDLSILFIFSKYDFLVSLIFSVIFDLYIIYFLSHLYYFLPSADLELCFFFYFQFSADSLDCLFEIFLISWGRLIAMNFSLRNVFASSHRVWKFVFPLSFVLRYFMISFFAKSKKYRSYIDTLVF